MKLKIKEKWFNEIKAGKKKLDYRDDHITFVCEETGEELRKKIGCASFCHRTHTYNIFVKKGKMTKKEFNETFEKNQNQIVFVL